MTYDEFTDVIELTRMDARGRTAARRVLVAGEPPSAVARAVGVSRQAVAQYVKRVRDAADERRSGLVSVTVQVPRAAVAGIRRAAQEARKRADAAKPPA